MAHGVQEHQPMAHGVQEHQPMAHGVQEHQPMAHEASQYRNARQQRHTKAKRACGWSHTSSLSSSLLDDASLFASSITCT